MHGERRVSLPLSSDNLNNCPIAHKRRTINATPTAYVCLSDDKSEEKGGYAYVDNIKAVKKDVMREIHKTQIESWDEMVFRATNDHAKSMKNKLQCHSGKKFVRKKQDLQSHIYATKHSDMKPFRCSYPFCSRSFSQRRSLKTHVDSTHSDLVHVSARLNRAWWALFSSTTCRNTSIRCTLESIPNKTHRFWRKVKLTVWYWLWLRQYVCLCGA